MKNQPTINVENCSVTNQAGSVTDLHALAVIELAKATTINALAITELAKSLKIPEAHLENAFNFCTHE
jgi:transcriptional regulator GlxA family with amidase domain